LLTIFGRDSVENELHLPHQQVTTDHEINIQMSRSKSIVFLGVDVDLFKSCFFKQEVRAPPKPSFFGRQASPEEEWDSFELIVFDSGSSTACADLSEALQKPGVRSVIFQDTGIESSLLSTLRQFYDTGGLVVFFGIYGDFSDPSTLSQQFLFPSAWKFSAYTKHEYEFTTTARDYIDYDVKTQEYTKSNLLSVPVQDRWMVAKAQPLHEYIEEHAGCLDGEAPDKEWEKEAEMAKAGYVKYCESLYQQCPLAVHKNKNGGRLAYIGFVNGGGHISYIVRQLVANKKIR